MHDLVTGAIDAAPGATSDILPARTSSGSRTIAVVDGYSTGRILVSRLHAAGVRCIHVQSQKEMKVFFKNGFEPEKYARQFSFTDDMSALVADLSKEDVSTVIPGTESGVSLADRLNAELGLPGNAVDRIAARRNKVDMARVAEAAGLRTPRGSSCSTAQQAVDWYLAQASVTVVVKPVDSAGTDNVRFCSGPEAVRAAAATVLGTSNLYGQPNRSVIVQERVMGQEFYVNTVSVAGRHIVAETWKYHKRSGPSGSPIYDYEEPVLPRDAVVLHAFVRKVLDSLGIRHGAAHTEVMMTDQGPVLIESGARLGGATEPAVVESFSGVSQTSLLATALTAPERLPTADEVGTWSRELRNVSLINSVPGTVSSLSWLRVLESLPTCVLVASSLKAGDEISATTDLIDSPGFVYLAAARRRDLERDYERLRQLEWGGLYTR